MQGPDDNAVRLTDADGLEDTSKQEVLMPASIKKDYKQIELSVIQAENFPKMDTFGTIDAYIKSTFQKKTYKT